MTHFYPDPSLRKFQYIKAVLTFLIATYFIFFDWRFVFLYSFVVLFLLRKEGIEINSTNLTFRRSNQPFGKNGKWEKISNYGGIVIKLFNGIKSTGNRSHFFVSPEIIIKNQQFDIYIMDETHRKKIFIQTRKTYDEALVTSKEISKQTNLPVQQFDPKQFSRHRRR